LTLAVKHSITARLVDNPAVSDGRSSHDPFPSVRTLTNEATGDTRTTTSGDRGAFTFRPVPPGSYTVKIALQGFRTHEQKKNVVNASNF
jgi:Carboxypeptidase regulatory-like domain